jgi:hypothetical protein
MSNRITWQQVSAPDFQSSAYLRGKASDGFAKALEGLGDVFGEAGEEKKAAADLLIDAKVADNLLRHRGVGTLDQALATQGLGALGIAPGEATAGALDKAYGYRSSLETSRANDTSDATNRFKLGKEEHDFGRQKIGEGRADEIYARDEEARQRAEWAFEQANKLADDPDLISPELAAERIIQSKFAPKEEEALLKAIGSVDPKNWAVGDVTLSDHELVKAAPQDIESIILSKTETLDNQERALARERGLNRELYYYELGETRFGQSADPLQTVISDLGADETSDEEGKFSRSRGELRGLYNDLTSEFKGVNPKIIAAVIQDTLTNTGIDFLNFNNDGQVPAVAEIRKILGGLDMPDDNMRLDDTINKYKREDTRIKNERAELTKLDNTLRAQIYRGSSPEAIQKTINGILELSGYANLSPEEKAAAAQTIMDAALKGSPKGDQSAGKTPAEVALAEAAAKAAGQPAPGGAPGEAAIAEAAAQAVPVDDLEQARAIQSGAAQFANDISTGQARVLDRSVGVLSGGAAWGAGAGLTALGYPVSVVSPEAGSTLMGAGRAMRDAGKTLSRTGFVNGTSALDQAAAPMPNPGAVVDQQKLAAVNQITEKIKATQPEGPASADMVALLGADDPEALEDPTELSYAADFISGETEHPVAKAATVRRLEAFLEKMNAKPGPLTADQKRQVRKAEKLLQEL